MVALEVNAGKKWTGRHRVVSRVAPGATATDLLAGREAGSWRDGGSEGLRSDMEKILGSQRMNPDEARAMIATWARSWFSADGVRVFYVVPRPLVDALLPLKIDPAPDRDRARARRPHRGAHEPAADRGSRAPCAPWPPPARRRRRPASSSWRSGTSTSRGRFLEPFLRGVLAGTTDPVVRAEAEKRLAALK